MSTAPWDIYAEQLTHLGYRYPLWIPDPAPGSTAVEIGDVGWINEGEFLPLFNAFRGEHEAQPRGAVPIDYVPLDIRECTVVGPRERISQSVLCSRSIRKVDVSGEISATVAPPNLSCSVNFNFECTDEAGALLVLGPSGRTQDVLSRQRIINYMEAHFDRWLEFANARLGLGLKEDQIMFVSGTTKTSRWGVAAFRGATREKRGTVVGNLGPLAVVDFSFSLSDAQLSSTHYRAGPTERPPCGARHQPEEYDQCIFIHYYKRKRRKWPLPSVIKAAAHPGDLPGDPDADSGDESYMDVDRREGSPMDCDLDGSDEGFQRFPFQEQRSKDPADYVLDYILENPAATVAIASDTDFFSLPSDRPRIETSDSSLTSPDDISAQHLSSLKPLVSVDQYGVGCLATVPAREEAVLGNRSHSTTPAISARNNIVQPHASQMTHRTRKQSEAKPSPRKGVEPSSRTYGNTRITGVATTSTSNPLKVVSAGCGVSHLQAMSAIYPSHSNVFQTIIANRKCWRVPKITDEVVWPSHLEAALMEGLEKYIPAESKSPRSLSRFPNRNKFIAAYILQKTGYVRTAKQVGARLQQLRDTDAGKAVMKAISDRHYEMIHPSPGPSQSNGGPYRQSLRIAPDDGDISERILAYTAMQETVKTGLGKPNHALVAVRYGFTKPSAARGPPRALSPSPTLERESWPTGRSTLGSDAGDPLYDIPPDDPDPPLLCDASSKRPLDAYAPLAYQTEPPTVDWGSHVLELGTTPARATARLGDPVPPGELLGGDLSRPGDLSPGNPGEPGVVEDLCGFSEALFGSMRFNA